MEPLLLEVKRLALGCAILHDPPVVFLDEPTSGVDPIARATFWDLIAELARTGHTVFVTTHYMDEAEYCNDIILINAGRLIANGSPVELKTEYITNPILEVRPAANIVEAMEVVRTQPWALETSVFGTGLHVMVADAKEGERAIRLVLGAQGIGVEHIERISPSLEDVFLYLLEKDTANAA